MRQNKTSFFFEVIRDSQQMSIRVLYSYVHAAQREDWL
jgi:hypothetical protein